MGHYDDIRESLYADMERDRDRSFLIEIMTGKFDPLIEGARCAEVGHVTIGVNDFNRMLKLLNEFGKQDETAHAIAKRRQREIDKSRFDALKRRLKDTE